jgi:predicted nucleic acid-binding protein
VGERIIDCCSLINLYTGWNGLSELRAFGKTWYVGESVLSEAQYTRDFNPNGNPLTVNLDLASLVDAGVLQRARAETEEEIEWYVRLATDLDDGEAQALAIAKTRGYVLLTDDAKATRLAATPDLMVKTVSTPAILREWVTLDTAHRARLPDILKRVSSLVRFRPRRADPDYSWWNDVLRTSSSAG